MSTPKYTLTVVSLDTLGEMRNVNPVKQATAERLFLAGQTPPPIVLCGQNVYDGINRIEAARSLGIKELPAAICPTAKDAARLRRLLGPNVVNGWQKLHQATP